MTKEKPLEQNRSLLMCSICNKEFVRRRYNQKYCSHDCAREKIQQDYFKLRSIPCEICGFDKITESHHIIKRQDYGSDEGENLVWLCPNHHKMADSFRYGEDMKKLIFKKTGKCGKLLSDIEIKTIEEEIADRIGNNLTFCPKDSYYWNSVKMMLITSGLFYRIARNAMIENNGETS